jgi:hypothetical protein
MVGIPSSMGRWKLDVRTGDRFTLPYYVGAVDVGALTTAGALASATAGRAFSLNAAGLLVPGLLAAAGAGGGVMPYFSWSGFDPNNYPDVQRDRGMPGYNGGYPIGGPSAPGFYGIPSCTPFANTGGFATIQWKHNGELSTTAFDSAEDFTPGTPLTCVAADSAELGNRGLIRNVEDDTDIIIGYVAPAGKFAGAEGYLTLAFIPTFVLPANATVPNTIEAND